MLLEDQMLIVHLQRLRQRIAASTSQKYSAKECFPKVSFCYFDSMLAFVFSKHFAQMIGYTDVT